MRKPESDEELLKMFHMVEINIPLLDAIKQIPKSCATQEEEDGGVELGGIVSTLTKNDEFSAGAQQALPKKC
ncbi:hypothetical protein CR513_08559, partial [Mucuna pruriens]